MPTQKIAEILRKAGAGRHSGRRPTLTASDHVRLWLDQMRPFNAGPDFDWDCFLQDFTEDPDTAPDWAKEHKILFLVTLHTFREKYLVMIKEAIDSDPVAPMLILAVTVNRSDAVVQAQKALKASYEASSTDPSRRQVAEVRTVWAENFEAEDLQKSLERAAVAILSEELDARKFNPKGKRTVRSEMEQARDELEQNMQVMLETISPTPPSKEEILESWAKLPESEQRAVLLAAKKKLEQGPGRH